MGESGREAPTFWKRVDFHGPMRSPYLGPCWLWTGTKSPEEYGACYADGRTKRAHRHAWELFFGAIPEGLVIDHLCRVPACVNPAHLEPVTVRENTLRGIGRAATNARKVRCSRGHSLGEENTVPEPGRRKCRICRMAAQKERRERSKGLVPPERMAA